MNLLKDNNICQFFIDGIYKVVSFNKDYKCLLVLMGFNSRLNLYQLVLLALLTKETAEVYIKFYIIILYYHVIYF